MPKRALKDKISSIYPEESFDILIPPSLELGDYSINLAFSLAKKIKAEPVAVAKSIAIEFAKHFDSSEWKIETSGPFINFYAGQSLLKENLAKAVKEGKEYGSHKKNNKKINIEFISANPTGPLTVGNARAGSYGDVLGNILIKTGHEVAKEYYINDVGNQVKKLTESVINKDLEKSGQPLKYSGEDLYKGSYIESVAERVSEVLGKGLAEKEFNDVQKTAININIENAKKSVTDLGVNFDLWFKESELHNQGEVEDALNILKKSGNVFEKDGATWLRFGKEENDVAVLVKSDGTKSYLMNDIAYTRNKLEKRKFDQAINIWGADHHGDVPRLLGATEILGHIGKLKILLHQLVALRKGGELFRMSKRAGNIETLDDLLSEAGKDAVRYFFLAKDLSTHMEFDLDLAKEQSNKNPIFYIQYAGARLNSIFQKAEKVFDYNSLDNLNNQEEISLMRYLIKFPDLIEDISENFYVHHLAQYAYELAAIFHKFYETNRVIQDDKNIQAARVGLSLAIFTVLENCLSLMGISMPEKM